MGYWGWRPLLVCVFFSVWVASCNIVSESAPSLSPTPSPRVTLTVRRIASPTATASPSAVVRVTARPGHTPAGAEASATPRTIVVQDGDTLGDIALRLGIDVRALEDANSGLDPRALQPGQSLLLPPVTGGTSTPTATPPALVLAAPTCYETPVGHISCLGIVENSLDHAIEQVELLVQIVRADGSLIAEQPVDIEQAVIPGGGSAPYRAVFDVDGQDFAGAQAKLQRADAVPDADRRFVMVDVQDQGANQENGRFVITATLHNSSQVAAQAIRLVATLSDAAGNVIGYRVTRAADSLLPGESIDMRVEIVPQIADPQPSYTLYVEARRGT